MKPNLNFSILNIDKPSGPTSFQVSEFIKKSLNLKKTSHFGTLDPKVTGVLPVALGRACKLNEFFMHKNKTYVGIARLHEDIDTKTLENDMKKFIGKIKQTPPVRSAVKRQEREREVFSFKLLEKNGKDFLFETEVQAGTYIRTLIHNLGENLHGAHMLELRRTRAGIFNEDDNNFLNLYDFEKAVQEDKLDNFLIPAQEAIKKVLPIVQLKNEETLKQLLTGKPIHKQEIENPLKENFALFHKNQFIGVYKPTNEKDIIARPLFVYN
jgi:H/ACA ribonucleoprotein complex subunit 4